MNELPARPPAHSNLPGALPGYFPPVHGALLLISSSRIGHHSTISYRYACKTLVRLNISPLVSCSLVNELLARLSAHANLLGTLLGYFPHVNIALPLTYSSRIRHYSTILPLHIQHLDSLEYLSFGVLFARERATRTPPSACQPTGGFARLLPTVHGALLLISSSRIGHHSTISYRYACKTLIRMNFPPLVSCSLVNELPARIPAHVNLPVTLPGYFPHVHGALLSTHSSRIGHYSTVAYRYISLHTVTRKTLIRLNIFPLVSCSLVNELPARPPSVFQPTGGFAGLLPTRPRRITTDLQFSDRPSQHNLIPLCMQDLDSHEHFPFGVLFARERATRTAFSACKPT